VLFDLDGTITDPAPGIIGSVSHALRELGAEVPTFEALRWVIGPPLRPSFERLLGGKERVEEAILLYRARYQGGAMFEAVLYPGIADVLGSLAADGYTLVLATSKAHVFARPILAHFELDRHFTAIHGAELDGRNDDKGELIEHILSTQRIEPSEAVMVGDRKYDVLGAARHGIATIGAMWGHGSEAELNEAGAAALCERPDELRALVHRHLPGLRPAAETFCVASRAAASSGDTLAQLRDGGVDLVEMLDDGVGSKLRYRYVGVAKGHGDDGQVRGPRRVDIRLRVADHDGD
jgi:phosphoglycolate phosphatase